MTESAVPLHVIEETSAYWRVIFDCPPFNIVDATIFETLQNLLARMDASPCLRVVVFESANPEFYLAHFELTGKIGNIMTAVGDSGLPIRCLAPNNRPPPVDAFNGAVYRNAAERNASVYAGN